MGEEVDLDPLVSPEKRRAIEAIIGEDGSSPLLRPIRDRLGDEYSYAEIRAVLAARDRITPEP
jgi:hypothetical protein